MIQRQRFFNAIRTAALFGTALTQDQVDGISTIFDEWDKRSLTAQREGRNPSPLSHLAYILATTKHETAHTMQPVREYGRGKGKKYGKPDPRTGQTYDGRGYVQLTWYDNYVKARKETGVDLVNHPDRAMEPAVAVQILFDGMEQGWFAGDKKGRHTLKRYLNGQVTDWINARRIINGTDKAAMIAGLAQQFLTALLSSANLAEPQVLAPPPPPKPVIKSTTILAEAGKAATVGGGFFAALQGIDWRVVAVIGAVALLALGAWTIRERLLAREVYGR